MLPMTESHECRNLIHAHPVNIPVLLREGEEFLFSGGIRSNGCMTGHALGNVRHVHQLAPVGIRVTSAARLFMVSCVKFVIERDGLFRDLVFALL